MASAPPAAGGRKILGLRPRTAIIVGVVVFAGGLGYFWWRSRQSSSSSSATTSSASAGAYSDAAQLDSIQQEIDQLLSEQGSGAGSGGSGSGSSGGTSGTGLSTTTGTQATGPTSAPPGTAVKTPAPPGTTATTPPKAAAKPKPAMPSARETKVTANSVTLSWNKVPNATTYRVRVTYQDKLVGAPHIVTGTSATISGLGANRTYTFHVAAIGPGGTSSETNGPAVKTKL